MSSSSKCKWCGKSVEGFKTHCSKRCENTHKNNDYKDFKRTKKSNTFWMIVMFGIFAYFIYEQTNKDFKNEIKKTESKSENKSSKNLIRKETNTEKIIKSETIEVNDIIETPSSIEDKNKKTKDNTPDKEEINTYNYSNEETIKQLINKGYSNKKIHKETNAPLKEIRKIRKTLKK